MGDGPLDVAPATAIGFCPVRWNEVLTRAEELTDSNEIPALSIQVQRRGLTTGEHLFGSLRSQGSERIDKETLFLIASLTKPLVAMATMLLVERGQLVLNQRVVDIVAEFREAPKRPMTIRHLLTHTSGLPDMLPNNEDLRRAHAPLQTFIEETCQTPLQFPPGRSSQYQSMGYALLGKVIEVVSGRPYAEFIRDELFRPLGMTNTYLGLSAEQLKSRRIAEVRLPERQRGGDDWNWNSRYWRMMGAPWGGAYSTVRDLSIFCRAMLTGGLTQKGHPLFSPATITEATTNRLRDFAMISDAERRTRGWGLGWRMNWREHRGTFSDLLPSTVFGHWGASGTLFWVDSRRELACVILSTLPLNEEISPLVGLSNMITSSFIDA